MNEKSYAIRKRGGPNPGDILISTNLIPWPLPDKIVGTDGAYIKVSESKITNEQAENMDMTHVMRGAEYEWHDD